MLKELQKNVPDALKGKNLDGAADKLSEEERTKMIQELKASIKKREKILGGM